ncbi:MAG: type II secretion system F family protein [Thiohalorhabdus sp.]
MEELFIQITREQAWTIASGLFFLAVVLAIQGVGALLLNRQAPIRKRLDSFLRPHGRQAAGEEAGPDRNWLVRISNRLSQVTVPDEDWQKSRIRQKLVHAGIRAPHSLEVFMGLKALLALGLLVLALLVGALVYGKSLFVGSPLALAGALSLGIAGYYLPDWALERRHRRRLTALRDGFADAMDMMVVCVEAGLGFDATLQRVSRELKLSHPEISEELAIVGWELRAGKSREEALKDLAERVEIEEVRALVSVLIQAERFGTGIGKALREQAQEMRTLRIQIAEEKAAKLPVKLIFPVILFIFPALFLVILGPAVIQIKRGLGPVLGG